MHDECTLLAQNSEETRSIGGSLAHTLYAIPTTVAFTGELGAGKTTFIQGFASALGVREPLSSPTYALEQRYAGSSAAFLHLDLYRLNPAQADDLIRSSDDFPGIRAIEWSERLDNKRLTGNTSLVRVHLEEGVSRDERVIRCTFEDGRLFGDAQLNAWRQEAMIPGHILDHCEAVARLTDQLADELINGGKIVRRQALRCAARIHDLFRFLDFRPGGHPDNTHSAKHVSRWAQWRAQFPAMHHEKACAEFLRREGYPVIADIVETHGLTLGPPERRRMEQQLLFYADKRVMMDKVVSLEERFADFAARYGNGVVTEKNAFWYQEAKKVEQELFRSSTAPTAPSALP